MELTKKDKLVYASQMVEQLGSDEMPTFLKKENAPLFFSDKYIVHSPGFSKKALRLVEISGTDAVGVFWKRKTNVFDWVLKRSVSGEGGIYAIPIDEWNEKHFFEDWFLFMTTHRKCLITLIEYIDEDVFYQTKGVVNEVCVQRCNIIYSAFLDDYRKNNIWKTRQFNKELQRLWLDSLKQKDSSNMSDKEIRTEIAKSFIQHCILPQKDK